MQRNTKTYWDGEILEAILTTCSHKFRAIKMVTSLDFNKVYI